LTFPENLTSVIFRALYREFDLLTIGTTYVVVPKGTLILAGDSLGQICRALAERDNSDAERADMIAAEPMPRRIP
jgi:hypothetical protein